MLFPCASGKFHGIINRQKYEKYPRFGSLDNEPEIIKRFYGSDESPAEDWNWKLGWGWESKPCKTMVADDDMKVDLKTMVPDDEMKVDSKLGWEFKPCKTKVAEDDDDMKNKKKKQKKVHSVELPCKKPKLQKVKRGKKLKGGFGRFLSNNGQTKHLVRFQKGCCQDKVDFDSLTGKHLIICCFEVPIESDSSIANECRAVIETYDHSRPFEIVVVVKMRSDADYNQKAAFDHFCSAFSCCFAVPLSDVETQDYILSCFSSNPYLGLETAILVDPNGLIMEAGGMVLEYFLYFGSEWSPAPFLESTLEEIDEQDYVLRCRFDPIYKSGYVDSDKIDRTCLSLYGDILLCNPHLTLVRFESDVAAAASTVLQLSTKYVGLYLCFNGCIMEEIKAVHDYCLANNQQLEIVLVCMSLFEEPSAYYQQLHQTLRLFNIKSWFLFHYDGKVCRRLWRIFGSGQDWLWEKLIIVPPNCESGELCGREVITHIGITEYPFTRSAILKRRLEFLRSLTPLHLFLTGSMLQNGKEYNSEQLRGKNLILYFHGLYNSPKNLLMNHYPKMKSMGWEVVFVPMDGRTYVNHKMPWPVMSSSAAAHAYLNKIMTFPEEEKLSRLVAVRKDGNIVSRLVIQRLKTDGVTESLFNDVLESDLAWELFMIPIIEDNGKI